MRFKKNVRHIEFLTAIIALLFAVVGCSGGGSGTTPTNAQITGVFLDSPVSGLGYETPTYHGTTGPGGAFSYQNGETVRFFVGDIILCEVEAMPIVTPMDCVDGADDVTHPMVTNMLVFLQSIDFDNDPENGIDIAELIHHEAKGIHLDFGHDPGQFRESYNFRYFLDLMSTRGVFHDFDDRFPPEVEQARSHMRNTIIEYGLYGYGPVGPHQNFMASHSGNEGQQQPDNMGPGSYGSPMGRGPYSSN